MYRLVTKSARLLFLGVLPLLIISSTGKDITLIAPLAEGTHALNITGFKNEKLKGNISFSLLSKASYTEDDFNILKLCFTGNGLEGPYTIEVLIPSRKTVNDISLGHYNVEDIDSFLMPFDGVFGAFNSAEFGDKPFFASSGMVRITQSNKKRIAGRLDLEFKDDSGNNFSMVGAFDAR